MGAKWTSICTSAGRLPLKLRPRAGFQTRAIRRLQHGRTPVSKQHTLRWNATVASHLHAETSKAHLASRPILKIKVPDFLDPFTSQAVHVGPCWSASHLILTRARTTQHNAWHASFWAATMLREAGATVRILRMVAERFGKSFVQECPSCSNQHQAMLKPCQRTDTNASLSDGKGLDASRSLPRLCTQGSLTPGHEPEDAAALELT